MIPNGAIAAPLRRHCGAIAAPLRRGFPRISGRYPKADLCFWEKSAAVS